MSKSVLTAQKFDEMMEALSNEGSSVASESLWGAKAIARFVALSEDTVNRLAKRDATFPVRRRAGRLYSTRTEMEAWLKPSKEERRVAI